MPKLPLAYRSQVPLAPFTSLKVGGVAEYVAQPRSISELLEAWHWAKARGLPITLIGAGSNLLIHDQGLQGLVICTKHLRGVEFAAGRVKAACGEPLAKLAWQCAERGWSGLQWGVGIPGTVGGVVYMNAGAQGGCCADILQTVEVLTPQGEVVTMPASALDFGYRHGKPEPPLAHNCVPDPEGEIIKSLLQRVEKLEEQLYRTVPSKYVIPASLLDQVRPKQFYYQLVDSLPEELVEYENQGDSFSGGAGI